MREFQATFVVTFQARDEEEKDEITQRLTRALEGTEWKVKADCIDVEETG